jgi:arginine deiminase
LSAACPPVVSARRDAKPQGADASSASIPLGLKSGAIKAEWRQLRQVLLHQPGEELFAAAIHPEAARLEKPFTVTKAQAEQRVVLDMLRKQGVQVVTIAEALLDGAGDNQGNPLPGAKLDELRAFAAMFLTYDASDLSIEEQAKQEAYKRTVIDNSYPAELVKIILLQPTVRLLPAEGAPGYAPVYEFSPVGGLVQCRDFCISTSKGLVLGRLNSPQRGVEAEIVRFALHKLGIAPVFEVQADGRLEGGDFFALGALSLLGQGLRTNEEAVRQLLQNKVFGTPRVAVVKDPGKTPSETHLDSYFNVLGPKLALLTKERYEAKDPARRSLVDMYELEGGAYALKKQDIPLRVFLEKELGLSVLQISSEDQRNFGLEYLQLGPNRILGQSGAESVSDAYKKALKENTVSAIWMEFKDGTRGFGRRNALIPLARDEK